MMIDVMGGAGNGATAVNNLGRAKFEWDPAIWDRLDQHVSAEMARSRIATKFLPVVDGPTRERSRSRRVRSCRLEERSVPFVLTKQQYEAEERPGTSAMTFCS